VVPVCSFCGEQPIVRWYEGPRFVQFVDRSTDVRSEDAWLVCAACAPLVDAADRMELARRGAWRIRAVDPERYVGRVLAHYDEAFWIPRAADR